MLFFKQNFILIGVYTGLQGVPKNPKTIENDLLLEFQCLALN